MYTVTDCQRFGQIVCKFIKHQCKFSSLAHLRELCKPMISPVGNYCVCTIPSDERIFVFLSPSVTTCEWALAQSIWVTIGVHRVLNNRSANGANQAGSNFRFCTRVACPYWPPWDLRHIARVVRPSLQQCSYIAQILRRIWRTLAWKPNHSNEERYRKHPMSNRQPYHTIVASGLCLQFRKLWRQRTYKNLLSR